jgi:hypothetical protein
MKIITKLTDILLKSLLLAKRCCKRVTAEKTNNETTTI